MNSSDLPHDLSTPAVPSTSTTGVFDPTVPPSVDREYLAQLLEGGVVEVTKRKQREWITCAELKANLQKSTSRSRPAWEFEESQVARILHPEQEADFFAAYRFNEFCEDFPKVVQLKRDASGGKVRYCKFETLAITPSLSKEDAKSLLIRVLDQYFRETHRFDIACSALKVRMKKASSRGFEEGTVGYSSFRAFLDGFPDVVQFLSYESGGRVRFVPTDVTSSVGIVRSIPGAHSTSQIVRPPAPKGYHLVNGQDILRIITKALGGHKATDTQRPRWEIVYKWVKTMFPAPDWKALYFFGVKEITEDMKPFWNYLRTSGYEVITVDTSDQNAATAETATERTMLKMLEALADKDAHVVTVSHSAACGLLLSKILSQRGNRQGRWAVVGLKEYMAPRIAELAGDNFAVIDIEQDCQAIPERLPRHFKISPEDFNPAQFL